MITKIPIILFLAFSLISCQKEQPDVNPPLKNKIKRKLVYNYIEDKNPVSIYEYQYDHDGKIEKIINGENVYEKFEYDEEGVLINKLTFHYANDTEEWLLLDSTSYSYKNGMLDAEETFYFPSLERILLKFEYENSRLVKKYKYHNQQFDMYTLYEYSNELCTKETSFKDSLGTELYHYTVHHYEGEKRVLSEKFDRNDSKIQEINYTYDDKGNLIVEKSVQLDETIVKPLYYVYRYEYY